MAIDLITEACKTYENEHKSVMILNLIPNKISFLVNCDMLTLNEDIV